jgi:hypothetical protein
VIRIPHSSRQFPSLKLSASSPPADVHFVRVLTADGRIGQKDDAAVVRSMCSGIARKRDARVALLPDCLRGRRARK